MANEDEGLDLACMKCGEGIHITPEQIEEMKKNGVPIQAAHELCPRDAKVLPRYRFVIQVYKKGVDEDDNLMDDELIAQVGHTTEAISFAAAFPVITEEINKQWNQVGDHAALADMMDG